MGFLDSYKRLEKLCGEVLNDNRRVSAYIDEMLRTPNGSYYVRSWDEDLKNLKHYRWVRNQISHDPACTERNMCSPKDALWIDNFYSRIMNQTDPLSLYRTAARSRRVVKPTSRGAQNTGKHNQPTGSKKTKGKNAGCAVFAALFLASVAGIVLLIHFLLTRYC
ncbi:MAG: hypothetical protein IKU30_01210 [Clostridia bacterium]|nr:hypothetical protein [Clostridia bacterium]